MGGSMTTQCFTVKTMEKTGRGQWPDPLILKNLCMKINAKLSGINSVVAFNDRSPVLRDATMILGADVNHPSPTDKTSPSIAAVVGSYDEGACLYAGCVSTQRHRVEIIKELKDHTKNLLLNFYQKRRGLKPVRLIMYRDGVSEGQFGQVLHFELTAIREACKEIQADAEYCPLISFVVVQKRHHTRFFPQNPNDGDKSGNIPAGTVVDKELTHPTEFDYFLNSHQGIQGTSRPTHYHTLWDDNELPADAWQQLTYTLCHQYARCSRAVSIPAPVYYADLLAYRGREYVPTPADVDSARGGSPAGGSGSEAEAVARANFFFPERKLATNDFKTAKHKLFFRDVGMFYT